MAGVTLRLTLRGRVQGVGFRPALYRLAAGLGLRGTLANSDQGVVAELEGERARLERLLERLPHGLPAHARLEVVEPRWLPAAGRTGLRILASHDSGGGGARIPADLATCADCLAELGDPADRRFRYPFTNCTACGPRFTIARALPYDRQRTTMAPFELCARCAAEYGEVTDRRYHAEPVACPACGPRLELVDGSGARPPGDPLAAAGALLDRGQILAVKGLGGFHLAVRAVDEAAVARLRRRKGRPHKPMAVMARDLAAARLLARVDAAAARLLAGPDAPIVLLPRRRSAPLCDAVAPGCPRVGVMLPYTPLHHLLLESRGALVMTSGNRSGEPMATGNDEALRRLAGLADAFLLHDREILVACDDSVVSHGDPGPLVIRRSRGRVPDPLPLPGAPAPALAVGGQLSNTCCLTLGRRAFPGPHVGELGSAESARAFRRAVGHLEALLRVEPRAVIHDLHPDYLSTRFAEELGLPALAVQHHHAHLAATLGEHEEAGPAVGLALDGTGLGDDGTVWGGELLLLPDPGRSTRLGHLRPFPLPGGEACVREPWRAALGLVWELLGEARLDDAARLLALAPARLAAARGMLAGRVATVRTSSCGRLFDAVSALCGACRGPVTYSGQAAVQLEHAAGQEPAGRPYPMARTRSGEGLALLDPAPALEALLRDLLDGAPVARVSARFHLGLARGLAGICRRAAEARGIGTVALGGGCLHNQLLRGELLRRLEGAGLRVLVPRRAPPNDGGLAYGQAVVWAARAGSP